MNKEPPPVPPKRTNPIYGKGRRAKRAIKLALTDSWQTTRDIRVRAELTAGPITPTYAQGLLTYLASRKQAERSTMHNPAPPARGVPYIYLWRLPQPKETP